MMTGCSQQLTLWNLGPQQVTVTFQGGRIVSDAGLLGIRKLDKGLGVLSLLAERLPDPRTQSLVVHSRETLFTQQVYQILAGYPDCNDAQTLRNDPLFHTLLDLPAEEDAKPLASGSTLARFAQAYTRRDGELPLEERPVLLEVAAAQNQRLKILNDYLPELFIRTRRARPACIILDIDASDDPTHGQQVLSFYHGYYEQHQYFPLYVFDGTTGFPLAAWLRPGTVHASCGAIDTLKAIIDPLRRAWPGITILVRGDGGFAVPAVYEFCEAEGLLYAFGYSTNAVLTRRTDAIAADLETYYHFYGERDPHVQRFEVFEDYQASEWTRPRRIVAKVADQSPRDKSAFRGHQHVGTSARPLSGILRTTRRRAGTADRRVEERLVGGPLVVSSFPRQLLEAAGTRNGVCFGDLASRSDGRDPRDCQGPSEHLANEAVESRSHRQDQRAPHLVSLLGNLAASESVAARLCGHRRVRGTSPASPTRKSDHTWHASSSAHVTFPTTAGPFTAARAKGT